MRGKTARQFDYKAPLKSHESFSFPLIKFSHITIVHFPTFNFSRQISTPKPFKMVSLIAAALSALCLAITASAAPAEAEARAAAAHTGAITWYNTGLGACGHNNNDGELVAAVSHSLYDREHPCGRKLRINYKGKSVVVTVVDRCGGCAENDIDLSPTAFRDVIGDLGVGRATATWNWA
ncbi:RlpA-like double-psi beta-barrel-containing domain-containing protein [Trichoderma ceciliae]